MAKLVSLDTLQTRINLSNKPFSPRLINWVEPIEVSGYIKTLIYTEVDSNLKVGERVFIINGNYDSDLLIKSDKYKKGRDGYKILDIDKCKITLDIDYTGVLPWNDDSIDNFIKVYPIRSDAEFRYINRMYSTQNATIDNKFNIYNDNVVFTDTNYSSFYGTYGENGGISSAPGFFIKSGTASWTDVTVDFTTNFPLFESTYSSLNSNSRIKIMNDSFTYNGQEFKEGFVYKFENGEWVVDVTYFRPFISKANFRDGKFKGSWNAGLYGRQDKKIKWEGINSTWNIGTLLNSIWESGTMLSTFTSLQSYYADIDEYGLPFQKINNNNNRGFGYNYVVDSEVNKSIIKNGNFYGTLLGTQSATFSVVEHYLSSWTQSLNISISGGEFNNCNFESSEIRGSELRNSRVNNSKTIQTKSVNSQFVESLFYASKFNSENIIKILNSDTWTVYSDPLNPYLESKIYKFYISEDNFSRLKHNDQFYINGISGGYEQLSNANSDLLTFFDKRFVIGDYTYHYDDTPGPTKNGVEYTVYLSSSKENSYVISGTSISGTNSINLPSIDIHLYNPPSQYISNFDITNAYIIDSDFRSGLFDKSDWNSGNNINNNYDNVIPNISLYGGDYNISITTPGDNKLTIVMPSALIEDNLTKIGSIVYLNSVDMIDVNSNLIQLPDTYRIYNILPPRTLILEELGTYSVIAGLSPSLSFLTNGVSNRYNYIHLVKINKSNIKSGIFRRGYIKNSVIYNSDYNNNDYDFTNLSSVRSLILSEMIFRNTNNSINSGIYNYTFLTDGSDKWNNGIFYNSSWTGQTFSNGTFKSSRWDSGVFLNGLFYKSNAGGGVSSWMPNYQSEKNKSFWRSGLITSYPLNNDRYSWISGNFKNGNFYKSGWESGYFENGKFYYSDFFNGTFSGGVLGDSSVATTDTNFYQGTFDNGTVQNANVYAKNTDFIAIPGPSSPVTITWNNGIFNSGIFGSLMYNQYDGDEFSSAIWNDGVFNGGEFRSNARWKNGTFNGGKFISGYGFTMSTSTYSSDYSWENGVFNGGEFGLGSDNFTNDYQFYIVGNSTWYTGEFNGGKFKGRVWNNGVLTAGDFEGSATVSSISPLGTTCSNPNQFTLSFGETGSTVPYYPQFSAYTAYGPGDRVWYNGTLFESLTLQAGPAPSGINWIQATMSGYLKKYYGLWRNGTLTDVKDKFIKDKKIFTDIQRKSTEKKISKTATIKNALWNTGTFSHPSGEMLNCVWLDGRFEAGTFKGSSFNPYVKRNNATQSTFNLDDNTCYWQNGTLDQSDFYISKWEDGKILVGTGVGMIWKNGIANYMNAFNVFWENGTWRNGNWYGSHFVLPGSGIISDDYTKQILFRGMSWSGTSSCHVWNIFTEDPTDDLLMVNATASTVKPASIVIAPPPVPPIPPPTP